MKPFFTLSTFYHIPVGNPKKLAFNNKLSVINNSRTTADPRVTRDRGTSRVPNRRGYCTSHFKNNIIIIKQYKLGELLNRGFNLAPEKSPYQDFLSQ